MKASHVNPCTDASWGGCARLPWSQGPIKGQINRLKMLKRQGYGRAGLPRLYGGGNRSLSSFPSHIKD